MTCSECKNNGNCDYAYCSSADRCGRYEPLPLVKVNKPDVEKEDNQWIKDCALYLAVSALTHSLL